MLHVCISVSVRKCTICAFDRMYKCLCILYCMCAFVFCLLLIRKSDGLNTRLKDSSVQTKRLLKYTSSSRTCVCVCARARVRACARMCDCTLNEVTVSHIILTVYFLCCEILNLGYLQVILINLDEAKFNNDSYSEKFEFGAHAAR